MFEIDKRQFGMFLASLRKARGMTQKQLAQALYISDKAVSKWETGQSLPDIMLLSPLAELLGVTVTELLECRRLEAGEALAQERVEGLLQKAAGFAEAAPERDRPRGKRLVVYLLCVVLSAAELLAVHLLRLPMTESFWLSAAFGVSFGAYFWLFAQKWLPDYYDSNPINTWSDGPVRMNIPGVRFNNRNWPHIVKTLRIWSALSMTVYPLIHLAGCLLLPEGWLQIQLFVFLVVILGGLFVPLVVVGRKYQ